jgi:competence protein ComEC
MRLPAVAIAAAFASGIAVGLHPAVVRHASSHILLASFFMSAALSLVLGILLVKSGRISFAAIASLLSWVMLGLLGVCTAEQPRSRDHGTSMIEESRLPLKTPLRWHAQLRDEPMRLPWGYGYEMEISGVEFEEALHPARGGLRLSFTVHPDGGRPTELHAGDEVAVLTEAKQPQIFRDEGAFDRRAYLSQQNIDLVATLRAPELIERLSSSRPTFELFIARVRRRLRDEVDEMFAGTPQEAGVLRAMLLGDRSFVEREEAADFQKTGVFHVLVVAGLHVGALAFALYWVGRKMRFSRVWTMVFTLTLLFAYVAIVEQRAPVLRAGMMAAIVVLGGFFFRRLELLNSAAIAALILLVAKPLALRDSSFQLTFLAIGCIGGLALPWLEKTVQPYVRALRGWRDVTRDVAHEPLVAQFRIDLRSLAAWVSARVPQRLGKTTGDALVGGLSATFRVWELLVLTMALQVGMLPLMARDFHRITLSAPLVNLAAVPMTGVIVPLGFLTLATGLIVAPAGKILAIPLAWLTALLLHIVRWFAHFPRWSYRIPGPPLWLIALFFLAAVLLAAEMRLTHPLRKTLVRSLFLVFAGCALTMAIYPFGAQWTKGKLELTVLDVGQGDSLLVVSPGGKTLLIDGGGAFSGFPGRETHNGVDPGEDAVSPYLWWRGFQKLDVVAMTHAHQDHLSGLTAILDNFHVAKLWIGREVSSPALAKLEELALERSISIEHELRGQSFGWDGVEGNFLWPASSPGDATRSARNDDSLVLRLRYGGQTLLLPGDAEKQAEREILSENSAEAMRSSVLKIGHHGSKNSTTPEFLAAVRPRVGIISAGEDNPYGHPSPELLDRLENAHVRILRTDRDGAVHMLTDGVRLEISCFVACPDAANAVASMRAEIPDRHQYNKNK